jgi:hypothetical protein
MAFELREPGFGLDRARAGRADAPLPGAGAMDCNHLQSRLRRRAP